eukprot:363159-Chlamydomonas_euryale.AAC.11
MCHSTGLAPRGESGFEPESDCALTPRSCGRERDSATVCGCRRVPAKRSEFSRRAPGWAGWRQEGATEAPGRRLAKRRN